MLEQAQSLAQRRGLTNLSWQQGEGEALPFADHSFSIVLSRYAFHHCLKPDIVLSEMIRVCRPGGKVLVADVSLPSSKVEAYDHLEKLRDPSHSHALSLEEFQSLATASNLRNGRLAFYEVKSELERQMAASFPNAGDEDEIRQIFIEDIGINKLGINTHLRGDKICYTVPITVMVAHKAA
jgi:SAM-dependent methyltransferase